MGGLARATGLITLWSRTALSTSTRAPVATSHCQARKSGSRVCVSTCPWNYPSMKRYCTLESTAWLKIKFKLSILECSGEATGFVLSFCVFFTPSVKAGVANLLIRLCELADIIKNGRIQKDVLMPLHCFLELWSQNFPPTLPETLHHSSSQALMWIKCLSEIYWVADFSECLQKSFITACWVIQTTPCETAEFKQLKPISEWYFS